MKRASSVLSVGVAALAMLSGIAAQETEAEAHHLEGARALGARDYPAAARALEKTVELDPDNEDAWFMLGQAHAGALDHAGAVRAYRRVVELDPRNSRAMNNLANGLFRMGRYEESAEWYKKALAIDPGYLKATFHYGWVLRQLDRPEQAEQVFRRCVELQPEDEADELTRQDCFYYVGALRFRAGDYEQAAAIMERVVTGRPAHPEARYYLGMAYRHLGRIEDAAKHLELHRRLLQAMRGDPEDR